VDNHDAVLSEARVRLMRALNDDDAVQSVLISLWQALQRGPVDVPKYLSTAIRNQKYRLMRRNYDTNVELTDEVMPAYNDDAPDRDYERLTADQLEIVGMLEQGDSAAEIAAVMGIHRTTLYRKIEAMRQNDGLQTQSI
jgi:DNA-directed RNA polymerase specialized sigma24 family protein